MQRRVLSQSIELFPIHLKRIVFELRGIGKQIIHGALPELAGNFFFSDQTVNVGLEALMAAKTKQSQNARIASSWSP